ncbi:hypothetical protein [Streptomyces chattanoogensis]|uniref:hypothetical protein n=1 Tax=Streptomyces chattanoogensis TaxID=66876 RepID=UPI003685420B
MKTPDDVPTSLTMRAYGIKGVSQNMYAAVVADAYDAIRAEVLREADEETRTAHSDHCIQAGEDVARLTEENARIRAELESSKAAHRAVWAKHQDRGMRIFELQGELAQRRADVLRKAAAVADSEGHDTSGVPALALFALADKLRGMAEERNPDGSA